jgi:sodium pump decarboxylase gamma subunit
MSESLSQGLLITVIGMGLVFGALILLWLLMALLSRLAPGRGRPESAATGDLEPEQAGADAGPPRGELAAIATALVLLRAEQEAEAALGWRLPPVLTRWVAVGYSRQLRSWQPRRTQRDA